MNRPLLVGFIICMKGVLDDEYYRNYAAFVWWHHPTLRRMNFFRATGNEGKVPYTLC